MKKGNRMPKNIKVKWFSIKFGMGLRPQCRIIIPFSDVTLSGTEYVFIKTFCSITIKLKKVKQQKREREWEYNKNSVLTTSKHLTRIKNTTTAVCVGFKRLRNADVLHFYSPISPALVPTDPFRYVEGTFCANHVGKLMENVILASGCAVCGVRVCGCWLVCHKQQQKRKEKGGRERERERWRFQRIFVASGYLS